MTVDREAEWTHQPEDLLSARVAGSVLYREVYDDVGLAGYVYCHEATGSESRAGIVLAAGRDDPSVSFQQQLGIAMLGVHPLTPAAEVIADVYVETPLELGALIGRVDSVDVLRLLGS